MAMTPRASALVETYRQVFLSPPREQRREIRGPVGSGLLRRIGEISDVTVSECRMRFSEETRLSEDVSRAGVSLLFCLDGGAEWDAARQRFELERGEVLLASADRGRETVCYAAERPYHFVSIALGTAAMGRLLLPCLADGERGALERAARSGCRAPMTREMRGALRQLTHCPYAGAAARLHQEAKLLELFAHCFGEMLSPGACREPGGALSPGIRQAIALLEAEPFGDWTLARLARACYLSESSLTRGFRRETGQSVHQYLIDRRMDAARALLERQRCTVSEAARRVGYSNMSHFAAAYQRRFGVNPGAFRRQCPADCPERDDD